MTRGVWDFESGAWVTVREIGRVGRESLYVRAVYIERRDGGWKVQSLRAYIRVCVVA
jgi:hypothetical protein